MSLYNKIFGKKDSISIDDIEKYASGNLSEEQMYDIELRANSSNIDSDAFDAFTDNPENLNEIKNIKAEVSSNLFKSTSYIKYFIITGIAAVLTIFFVFYAEIFNTKDNNNFIASNTTLAEEIVEPSVNTESNVQQEFFINDVSIENDLDEQTPSNNIEKEDIVTKDRTKSENIEHIKQKEMQTITVEPAINNNKILFAYNANIKHIIHYKIVDYSFYNRDNKSIKKQDIGLDARFANQEDKAKEKQLSDEDLNIAYFSYLEKALNKYHKKEFSVSISMFNEILIQYPNDLNALFYKGMAFYKLKKYNKAIKNLDKVVINDINVFHQEAEYYKALSLLHTNKAEGLELLNKIADEALFYSQKAIIELSKQ